MAGGGAAGAVGLRRRGHGFAVGTFRRQAGSTSVCRATLFGDRAQAMADKIKTGTRIRVEGMGAINTWEKDGEKRHGLSILAQRAKVEDGDGGDSSGGRDAGVRHPQPQVISSLVEEDGDDMFR